MFDDFSYICELIIRKKRMLSSQNKNSDLVFLIYKSDRTVFRLNDIAMISGEMNFLSLNKKLNYLVRTGRLLNPRKGIYTKPDYSLEELACRIYSPAYISLEYVLMKAGIIFQYDTGITAVSYLSRSIEVVGREFRYRKIKGNVLVNTTGIIRQDNHVNIATPERAFLDVLYLDAHYYFDNTNSLDKEQLAKILPIYQSTALNIRTKNLF